MAGLDLTGITAALKDYYSPLRVANLFLQSKAYTIMPKNKKFDGDKYVHPIQSAMGSGYSATASVAFSSTSAATPAWARWEIEPKAAFCGRVIAGNVIDRTRTSGGSFVGSGVQVITKDAYEEYVQNTGVYMWGTGTGVLGQISTVSGTVVRLTNPRDALKFRIGQILQASATNGGGAVESGTVTLAKVDPNTGDLTATGNWSAGIATIAAGQFLCQQGTYDLVFRGIPAWIPTPAARQAGVLSTTFNNVNRSLNPLVLAGHSYEGNGDPKITTIERLAVNIASTGGVPTHAIMSFDDYADVLEALGTRAQIVTEKAYKMPQISFGAIELATSVGTVKVIADQFVPADHVWIINISEWEFFSAGEYPYTRMHDGLALRALENSDDYGYRIKGIGDTYCNQPFHQGVARFS